jgi:hypothetical protein
VEAQWTCKGCDSEIITVRGRVPLSIAPSLSVFWESVCCYIVAVQGSPSSLSHRWRVILVLHLIDIMLSRGLLDIKSEEVKDG